MSFIHLSELSGKSLLYAQGIPHSPFNKSFRSWMQQPLCASAGKRSADVRPCSSHLQAPVKLISPILKNRLAQSLASFPSALFFHQKPLDPGLCSLPSLQRTWFSFGLALVVTYSNLAELSLPALTNNPQHKRQRPLLSPAYPAARLAFITCLIVAHLRQKSHEPLARWKIGLSGAYHFNFSMKDETEVYLSPPPSHIQNITSHTLVKHLMVAKRWISSRRKTGNLPLKTGHLKIDKMLSYAVYHWHTAWNLKQIMLWTSNTSLKIEKILLASVVCSFRLLTLGV